MSSAKVSSSDRQTNVSRNDAAIQKAKDLAALHNVKTSAYKVDGK